MFIGLMRYLFVIFIVIGAYGLEIPKFPKLPNPKINKFKAIRNIKRGIAIGGSIGAGVPVVNELISFSKEINTVRSKFDHSVNQKLEISNPSMYTTTMKTGGDPWSYSKLIHSIIDNDLIGISIHQDGNYALVIDKYTNSITPENIHYVLTIPTHMNELIDTLVQHNINFDIFK